MLRITKLLLIFGILLTITSCRNFPIGKDTVPPTVYDAVNEAFITQARENEDEEIVFLFFDTQVDHIEFNSDQTQALIWFALLDKESREVSGTEPGLVLAQRTGLDPADPAAWTLTFQHEPEWITAIWDTDAGLLNNEDKQTYSGKAQVTPYSAVIFTGYKLPWEQGEQAKLSGSIAHVFIYKTCPTTCLYAFDFWTGEMFPVHAAKGGVVKFAKWDVPNGETSATNYLLIEDTTTSPTTYAIYYHLAYESIPQELRTPGAQVYQGQFIANADDTGASTAHHLHFMVHTNPSSYWGSSVDIVFDEVTINDGRPRTCTEATLYPEYGDECITGDWFTSDNADNRPPTAWITTPTAGTTVTSRLFTVNAMAQDDVAVKTISMFLRQEPAGWQEVAESQNQNILTAELDLCSLGLADGAFQLALEVVDVDNKVTQTYQTPHSLIKNVDCTLPPPACIPGPKQIALFTQPNYQGNCTILNTGIYYGMVYVPGIENDEVSSLLIGNQAFTVLFRDNNLKGIYEMITAHEPDLSENTLGDNTLSSLGVYEKIPDAPHAPVLPDAFTGQEGELIQISWTGDAEEYYAILTRYNETIMLQDWTPDTSFTMGYLPSGIYTLVVKGRNPAGESMSSLEFAVASTSATQPQSTLDLLPGRSNSTAITLNWQVTQGQENIDHFTIEYRATDQPWVSIDDPIQPDQRSLVVVLPPGYTYEFRMRAIAIDGTSEEFPTNAETITVISPHCIRDLYETGTLDQDITPLEADKPQLHTFCPVGDMDQVTMQVDTTAAKTIVVDLMNNLLLVSISVEAPNGEIIQKIEATEEVTIRIEPTQSQFGEWTITFSPDDPLLMGENTAYLVSMGAVAGSNALLNPVTFFILGILLFGSFVYLLFNRRIRR